MTIILISNIVVFLFERRKTGWQKNEIELTETLLDAIASTYHTIAQASREEGIPYRKLRAALIKNGNYIPKARPKIPDKETLLNMFRKHVRYYIVAAELHIDPKQLKQHCISTGIHSDVREIVKEVEAIRYQNFKKSLKFACRYNKKGRK